MRRPDSATARAGRRAVVGGGAAAGLGWALALPGAGAAPAAGPGLRPLGPAERRAVAEAFGAVVARTRCGGGARAARRREC